MAEVTAAAAIELIRLLEKAGIEVWLDGGWGVDALLGEQTRTHRDLDIILDDRRLSVACTVLSRGGFTLEPGDTPSNPVFTDRSGLRVDVHAVRFDRDGNGTYGMPDGKEWTFPSAGFAGRGAIGGEGVRCLSAEVQVLCHAQGYAPSERDLRDMDLLRVRFGVELPAHLGGGAKRLPPGTDEGS